LLKEVRFYVKADAGYLAGRYPRGGVLEVGVGVGIVYHGGPNEGTGWLNEAGDNKCKPSRTLRGGGWGGGWWVAGLGGRQIKPGRYGCRLGVQLVCRLHSAQDIVIRRRVVSVGTTQLPFLQDWLSETLDGLSR